MKTKVEKKIEKKVEKKVENENFPNVGEFQIRKLKETENSVQIKIDNVRLNWTWLNKPQISPTGDKAKFSVTCLIPKNAANFEIFKTIAKKIVTSSPDFSKLDAKKKEEIFKTVIGLSDYSFIKDGDKQLQATTGKPYDGCARHYTLSAKMDAVDNGNDTYSTKYELPIVRADKSRILPHEIQREIYSGVFASVVVTLKSFDFAGKKGITCYLNAVQKLSDAPKLGQSATDFFEKRDDLSNFSGDSDFSTEGF